MAGTSLFNKEKKILTSKNAHNFFKACIIALFNPYL